MQNYKTTNSVRNPIELLYQIGESVVNARSTNQLTSHDSDSWQGIGFSLCGRQMVSRLGEVVEVLKLPDYTALYGAEPWMLGVVNVRSQLIVLVDLETYFGSSFSGNKSNLRVLMVEDGASKIGLVVSKVFGLRSFPKSSFKSSVLGDDELLSSCVNGVVESSGESRSKAQRWHRFSIENFLDRSYFGH